ncbi:riboflavin synthase [Candidatus Sumerlaeota bacterium]|nr:riboflavin synthase [Candidatus Sumerlaeota bacterium]
MFTGLIQEIGRIDCVERQAATARIVVAAPEMAANLAVGESVAIDGVCLTVERADSAGFTAFASEETLIRTTLGEAASGRRVNLERALRLGDRLGGHWVAGHVDATGQIRLLEPRGEGWWLEVSAPEEILAASVSKGSIAVDGISLTLVDVAHDSFTVAVIPETYEKTTLRERRAGDRVNLESDPIGKYVLKGLSAYGAEGAKGNERMMDLLRRSGFVS